MRFYADLSGSVIQETPPPSVGTFSSVNGKCFFDAPSGVAFDSSTVTTPKLTPTDGTDIPSLVFNAWKAANPFSHLYFNPLMSLTDMTNLVGTSSIDAGGHTYAPRYQSGRTASGFAPNSLAMLPVNPVTSAPGCITTPIMDISGTVPAGVSELLLYWDVTRFTTTNDVQNYSGTNSPAIRQNISVNGNASYTGDPLTMPTPAYQVGIFDPTGAFIAWATPGIPVRLCNPLTQFIFGFVNYSPAKLFLLSFAFLY